MFRLFRYHAPTQSATPPREHVLVFDGGCHFCAASAEFIRRHARTKVRLVPFSKLGRYDFLISLNQSQILVSAHYITPEGKEYHGGESITRALRLLPRTQVICLLDLWGVAFFRELAYTLVASSRPMISKLTRLLGFPFPI